MTFEETFDLRPRHGAKFTWCAQFGLTTQGHHGSGPERGEKFGVTFALQRFAHEVPFGFWPRLVSTMHGKFYEFFIVLITHIPMSL